MQINFTTEDGVELSGYLLKACQIKAQEQQVTQPKAVVLINPGTATKTTFYLPFAQFLAEHGYEVLLWNYRGFCESRRGSLKGVSYSFSDIGKYDIPAAVAFAKSLYPEVPLYCVGHSTGGQQIGIAHNRDSINGLIAVAVSAGFFRNMPVLYRLKAYFFFFVLSPITSRLLGYVPAKRLNLMEDLPAPLAKEWGQWCQEESLYFSPKYLGKDIPSDAFKGVRFPIHVISAEDDEISTSENVTNFWKHVTSRHSIDFKRYKLEEAGNKPVGHFGYFKKNHKHIWQDILNKLSAFK